MGDWVKLKADDGHELGAYVATPAGEAVGAVVVVQEIFGVNKSIRAVADGYASEGFLGIAPALFDRFERECGAGLRRGGHEDGVRSSIRSWTRMCRCWILRRRSIMRSRRASRRECWDSAMAD